MCSSVLHVLLAAAAVLSLAGQLVQQAAGQGLAVSTEALGAGELTPATQFDYWEQAVALGDGTGGRGKGQRGGTGNLAGSLKDVDQLQQLQRAMYYIGGGPTAYFSGNRSDTGDSM